jgi:hypothetical protein
MTMPRSSFFISHKEYKAHAKKMDALLPSWYEGGPFSQYDPWVMEGAKGRIRVLSTTGRAGRHVLHWEEESKVWPNTVVCDFCDAFPELGRPTPRVEVDF